MMDDIRQSGRLRSALAASGAFLLVLTLAGVGWLWVRPSPAGPAAQWKSAADNASATPGQTPAATVAPTTQVPTPTPTPSATKKPVTTKKPTVTVTKKPPPAQLPPPPPAPVVDSPSCTQHPGPDAPPGEVSAALVAAGARQYWVGVQPPAGLVGQLPNITVPANMMKAVAWAESSWRSTVISCDHGIGLMQIMEGTRDFINGRFGTNYNVNTVPGNTALGAAYIEWLTMYFGLYYFAAFDLNATAAVGDGGVSMRLRDVVIAAYNVGHRAVENEHGTTDASDDTLSIPNQWYVDRVTGYLTNCPCPA